jgi:hypothetical protein
LKKFLLHAVFLGAISGSWGWFLIHYGFLYLPAANSTSSSLTIEAVGEKSKSSKSSEVWFYGAYRSNGEKVRWSEFVVGPSWEQRGETYVSYKNQPNEITLATNFDELLRLDFGSHADSGLVRIKWQENIKSIDLYSKDLKIKTVVIDPSPGYRHSKLYPLIIFLFVSVGVFIAIPASFSRGRKVYYAVFASALFFSIYITLAAFFPGVYTSDSTDQLKQAITGSYHDWQPPAMAWFWSVLIRVTGQVESLMIFHLLILAAGAFCWARILERLGYGIFAFIIPVIVASPVIVNFSGVVWKDVGFAYTLLLASGIAGLAIISNRIYLRHVLAVMLLLVYAYNVRSNGIFSVMPIIMFTAWLAIANRKPDISRSAVVVAVTMASFASVAVLIVGAHYFAYDVLKSEKRYPFQYLQLYDISGISKISRHDYFPEYIKRSDGHDLSRISDEYEKSVSIYGSANNLVFPAADGAPAPISMNRDPALQAQLRKSWLEAIVSEPIAYWKHRLSVLDFLMTKGSYWQEWPQSDENRSSALETNLLSPQKIKFEDINFPGADGARKFVLKSVASAQGTLLYNSWTWLGLLLAEMVLGLAIFGKTPATGRIVVMVSSSGLLYLLPYIIVAPASDFRYLYWGCVAGSFTGLLLFAYAIKTSTQLIARFFTRVNLHTGK